MPLLSLLAAMAMVLLAAPLPAQPVVRQAVGADDPRIDSVFRFIQPDAPGCAVGVYRGGVLTWARGYGLASLEHAVPITPSTIFDLGSTSKQFTAALTLLLVQDGLIGLDDAVRQHIPELPAWGDSITIRQLLHHTAGVRDYLTLFSLAGVHTEDLTTQADAVHAIARQRRLGFTPGSDHSYSNSGYVLLAELIARRTGKSFGTVAHERLFEPLDMQHSLVMERHGQMIRRKAGSYVPVASGFETEWSDFEQVGDGAVHSSLEDLARWISNYDSHTVGGSALVRELERTGQLTNGRPLSYARGLQVDSLRGMRRVRHGGSWVGFRSDLIRFPDRKLALAALCNRGDAEPGALLDVISEFLLDDLGVPHAVATGAAEHNGEGHAPASNAPFAVPNASQFVGTYLSYETGRLLGVKARGDTVFGVFGSSERALRPRGDREFVLDGAPVAIAFAPPQDGAVSSAAFTLSGGQPDSLQRIAPDMSTNAATLESLTGTWHSEELGVSWTVRKHPTGTVLLETPRGDPRPLQAVAPGFLRAGSLLLRTTVDATGAVSGFTASAGLAKGLVFVRSGS